LPAPVGPTSAASCLPRLDAQVDALDRRPLRAGVGEGDVAQLDHALHPLRRERAGRGRLAELGLEVEVGEDALQHRERGPDLDHVVEELADRPEQPSLQRGEGNDRAGADRVAAVAKRQRGHQEDACRRRREEDPHPGPEDAPVDPRDRLQP